MYTSRILYGFVPDKKKPRELEAEQFDVTLFRKVISTRIREKNIVFHAERKRNELQNRQQTRAIRPCMIEKVHIIFLKTKGDNESASFFRGAN